MLWVVYRRVSNPSSGSSNKGKTRPDQHSLDFYHADVYLKCQKADCSITVRLYNFGPKFDQRKWPRLSQYPKNLPKIDDQLAEALMDPTTIKKPIPVDLAAEIRMDAASEAIDRARLPYGIFVQNSNTAADIVVRAATYNAQGLPETNVSVPPIHNPRLPII